MQAEPGTEGKNEVSNPYANPTQAVTAINAEPVAPRSEQLTAAPSMLMAHIVRSANWFYWIAGLSLVNLIATATGTNFRFIIGLGFSELLGGLAKDSTEASGAGGAVAGLYLACLALTGFFAACGWFARRPSIVAFVIGTGVFALDTAVFALASDWIGVAFHAWAIYALWRGIAATRQFKELTR